jgi:hypothetical protein
LGQFPVFFRIKDSKFANSCNQISDDPNLKILTKNKGIKKIKGVKIYEDEKE